MTEINKDEILKPSKWARFIFMFGYAFVLNLLLPIYIGLAFIQFLFFLVTSKPNTSIQKFNSSMVEFFSDTLRFLLFGTDEKPFPFKNEDEETPNTTVDEVAEVEEVEVEEVVPEDLESDTSEIKE
jgi:hypothetical protein|tara:strand:+ start:39 stop:416 length:378 start_codon:yes stop_codon:yes gene_type:complete